MNSPFEKFQIFKIFFAVIFSFILIFSNPLISLAASVTINASSSQGTIYNYNEVASNIVLLRGSGDRGNLQNLGLKYVRAFWKPAKWSTAENTYDFNKGDDYSLQKAMLDEITSYGASPIVTIWGSPSWNTQAPRNPETNVAPPANLTKYEKMVEDGLKWLKTNYPKTEYIQVWNEPNKDRITGTDYFNIYKAVEGPVKRINATLPSNVPRLKIGGMTLTNYVEGDLKPFFTWVKQNNIQLDFVSWHAYGYYPTKKMDEVKAMKAIATGAGLDPSKFEIMISEWGCDVSPRHNTSTAQLSLCAAYAAANYRAWQDSGVRFPSWFSISDYNNNGRSILTPARKYDMDKKVMLGGIGSDGTVFPVYNVMKMWQMLGKSRLQVGSTLDSRGEGLDAIAGKDTNSISAIIWNIRRPTGSQTISFNNLPSNIANRSVRVEKYLIDQNHSNYSFNSSKDKLEKISDQQINLTSSYSFSENMQENAVMFIKLTGQATGSTSTPQPTSSLYPADPSDRCQPLGDMSSYPNCKGSVNALDLAYFLSKWDTTDFVANLDNSGKVNALDLSILIGNLGI